MVKGVLAASGLCASVQEKSFLELRIYPTCSIGCALLESLTGLRHRVGQDFTHCCQGGDDAVYSRLGGSWINHLVSPEHRCSFQSHTNRCGRAGGGRSRWRPRRWGTVWHSGRGLGKLREKYPFR